MKVSCPKSPTGWHITHVDRRNHESCIYCPYEKQNPIEDLQPVYFYNSSHYIASQREAVLVIGAQRSELAKYFC